MVNYASNIWMHAFGRKSRPSMNGGQRIRTQTITGTSRTVATAIADVETSICTVTRVAFGEGYESMDQPPHIT